MESNEIKSLERLKKLSSIYFSTLTNDKTGTYMTQIKFTNYFELGCAIKDILKLCILAVEHDAHKISDTNKNSSINVALILEMVLEMFPMNEFELLSDISEIFVADSQSVNQK